MKRLLYALIVLFISANLFGQSIQFIKNFGDVCPDFGLSVDQTKDNGYILLGHTQNYSAVGQQDILLIKTDSLGNFLWQKLFGGSNLDFGQSVQQTFDKGFIICGFTNSFGAGGNDIYIVKTDSIGNFQWQNTFGGTGNDYGYCV